MSEQMINVFEEKYGTLDDVGQLEYVALLGAFSVGWNACEEAVQHLLNADVANASKKSATVLKNGAVENSQPKLTRHAG